MPSMTMGIAKNTPLHRRLKSMLETRIQMAKRRHGEQHDVWKRAEESILAYVPETEIDHKRKLARDSGRPSYTTIKIPYSYALLMAAHTYWTSVFFARNPVLQFAGRHGESEQQVQAVEALCAYQIETGGALAPYYIWLYDAGKYGVGIVGSYWDQEIIRYSHIEPNPEKPDEGLLVTDEVMGYEGNKVYNVSPWDFLPDPRVPVGRFQEGEFVAVKRRLAWNDLKRRERLGYYMNLEHLRGGGGTSGSEQHSVLIRPEDTDYVAGHEEGNPKHPAVVKIYEVYVDLIPDEWGVGTSSYPEKWVFTITDDLGTIIGAQPLGQMHGKFPFDVLESEVEAYGAWNRGIPQIIEPLQDTMDWLLNSHFYNVRAALNNMFIADPTRIVIKDLQNPEPGMVARLKPEAYGTDIRTFFQQLQVQDVTQGHTMDMQHMLTISERVTGINDQILGVLGQGGRKTATEIRTSTGFGVNRLKTASEYMSVTGFAPHAMKMVQQSQQYYSQEKQLRLVGDLAAQDGGRFLQVTPELIAGFYNFVPVDGTLPVDRLAQANLWKEILGALRHMPQILAQYDMAKIFGHIAQLTGIRNLNQFKVDPQTAMMNMQTMVQGDEELANEAQKGNIVPIRGTDPAGTGISM
jgi:hypothetical protein